MEDSEITITFTLEGKNSKEQYFKDNKMKDICQKFAKKMGNNADSFLFLYEGNRVNFDLSIKDQMNLLNKNNNKMNIIVYDNKKLEEKINDIKLSNNKFKDFINNIKLQLENLIEICSDIYMNTHIKILMKI